VTTGADPGGPHWHRISPLAVVFFIIEFVRKAGVQVAPGLIFLFAALSSRNADQAGWVLSAAVALLVIAIGFAILAWLRFRYRLTDQRVLVRKGVLHREELDIEFSRVQNVTIREPFYMRPLGLAVLGIETAGSRAAEVTIAGLVLATAQATRATILDAAAEAQEATETADREPRLLLALTRRDIVIHGLTANFMLWLALAVGALFGSEEMSRMAIGWLESQLHVSDTVRSLQSQGGVLLLALAGTATVLLLALLLPLVSVIGALLRYDGYRLGVLGETYHKSSGLLSRQGESLKRHKIQAVVWQQNAVARLFRRVSLQLRQASAGSALDQGKLPGGMKSSFLVPALHLPQALELSTEFLSGCQPQQADYAQVDRTRFMLFNLAVWLLPLALCTLLPSIWLGWGLVLVFVLVSALILWLTHLRWRACGYAVDGEYGFVRSGMIGSRITLFPLFKVQRIDIRQTPLQHRKGLAHLTIHLASHSLSVPYLSLRDAQRLRDLALYHAESDPRPWF
jgi:putative membrane protein